MSAGLAGAVFAAAPVFAGTTPPRPVTGRAAAWPFVPCLVLRTQRLTGLGHGHADQEFDAAVLDLAFDYGGTLVKAGDTTGTVPRARAAEIEARRVLESFGPVELGVIDDYEAPPGARPDYVVRVDCDASALCSFSAYAVPQLRNLGWRIEIAADHRWKVVAADLPWYADVQPADGGRPGRADRPDWFNLELGVEVDGQRVNLLPALLDMLERSGRLDGEAGELEGLAPRSGRPVAVPVAEREYVLIAPERLRTLLRILGELYGGDRPRPVAGRFSALEAAALAGLDGAFPEAGLEWRGAHEVRARGQVMRGAPDPEATEAPAGLRATLRPYQQAGLAWLQRLRACDAGGILADDMGLGKTLQTIAHLVAEKEAGRLVQPAMIVAPTSLIGNWQRELEKFAPELRVVVLYGPGRRALRYRARRTDVVLTTYTVLVRDQDFFEHTPVHLLILDEAQAIKNPRSQAHRAVKALPARHRLCLTGTPIENGLFELWAAFDFLSPGLLGNQEFFRQRFQVPIEREASQPRLLELRQHVAPFVLRRTKDEVATELPPKTEIVRPVELTGAQRDLYESIRLAAHSEVRRAIADKGFAASKFQVLDALMKLRQVCCDPRLVPVESAQAVKASAKYDLLFELLEQQLPRGRRVLIFSQFAQMLALIARGLRERGTSFVALTGSTPNRQKVVDTFESRKVDVFLISLKAGGTGLNLVSADTVIHYDPWWNPAVQAQATDRAYRIGQTKPVFVYNLIAAGSVEERMLGLQRRKRALADGILAGGGAAAAALSAAELDEALDGLMAPLDPEP
jgi:superfamily II DNA or RNA helicase